MNLAEAHRQYQLAMEHRRTVADLGRNLVSSQSEVDEALRDEDDARAEVHAVWLGLAGHKA